MRIIKRLMPFRLSQPRYVIQIRRFVTRVRSSSLGNTRQRLNEDQRVQTWYSNKSDCLGGHQTEAQTCRAVSTLCQLNQETSKGLQTKNLVMKRSDVNRS